MGSPSSQKKNLGAKCKSCNKRRTRADWLSAPCADQVLRLTRQLGNRTQGETIQWLIRHAEMPPHLAAPLPAGDPPSPAGIDGARDQQPESSFAGLLASVGLEFSENEIASLKALMSEEDKTDGGD